ncbi:hypothetical protein [Photobacterium sp. J15]|uniref:hypothetical protein n=1 Tax=Photobacterium sp. J15 TaxID=265901 RepID=UPI0007E3D03A|nr:hypothetical protein [Photobacterium sp. J15]
MEKFSDRYLNYFADGRIPRGKSFLWPVWVWEVLAPDSTRTKLNLFQRTILGLINAGRPNPEEIAEWLGIEKEMVLYIIACQLQPNGWLDKNGKLTETGLGLLENDLDVRRSLTTAYVFQDAISGKLWPRVAHSLSDVEPESTTSKGTLVFMANRETGWQEEPYVVQCQSSQPERPPIRTLCKAIQQGNNAIHNQKVRGEVFDTTAQEFRPDEIDYIDEKPFKAYVFGWVIDDKTQYWTVTDPIAISSSADYLRKDVFLQAQNNRVFAGRLSKFIGQAPEKETWEEMNRRLAAEVDFKTFANFKNIERIPNLSDYLGALLRREQLLIETGDDDYIRFEDCDDIITQAQKVYECCFKWMLDEWPSPSKSFIKNNWKRDDVRNALEVLGEHWLSANDIENLANIKPGSIHYAAMSEDHSTSLRPLIAACIFIQQYHEEHPLIKFTADELAISSILRIANIRNESAAHASGKKTDKEIALECAKITTQWVEILLGKIE